MSANEQGLLKRFIRNGCQDSFTSLVRLHVNLVYSAALRQVRSHELAEEVVQSVFADLARNASKLRPDSALSAWLYSVTRRTSIDAIRKESRRIAREQLAVELADMNSTNDWNSVEPLLDEAMSELEETDRTALILRFFENHSLRVVGTRIGTSDDAAQKRISRALDRLKTILGRKGTQIGSAALAATISANAVQAAPATLTNSLAMSAILSAGATATIQSPLLTAAKTLVMTTTQKTLVGAALVAAIATGIHQTWEAGNLRGQLNEMRVVQSGLSNALFSASEKTAGSLKTNELLMNEIARLRANASETLKLRAEIARLRELASQTATASVQANDPSGETARSWLNRVQLLKNRFNQTPEAQIPEMKLVTEKDWLDACKNNLENESDYREALSRLRHQAEGKLVGEIQPALKSFLEANDGKFPTALSQLAEHFKNPLDPALMERWAIVPAAELNSLILGGDWIITQKSPIDKEKDSRWGIGPFGYGTTSFNSPPAPTPPAKE